MDATLAEKAGTYATPEHMAQAVEAALQQAGFLSPTDESWQVVRARLDESLVDREAEQRKHHHTVANLKRTITELEERIMSYTGLAVTKSDYALLMETSRTLRVAEQTMKALKSQVANHAAEQAAGLQAIAKRVHAQLRSTLAASPRRRMRHDIPFRSKAAQSTGLQDSVWLGAGPTGRRSRRLPLLLQQAAWAILVRLCTVFVVPPGWPSASLAAT